MKEVETSEVVMSYQFKWKGIELNKWEHEILLLLIEGYTYKHICKKFLITFDTFFSHIRTIYIKLQKAKGKELANEFLYRVSMQAIKADSKNIHTNRHSIFKTFYNNE